MTSKTSPKDRLIFVGEHNACGDVTFHEHPVPELILIVEGTCQTDTPSQQFASGPGDLLLIPAGVSHNQIEHGDVRTLYLGFDEPDFVVPNAQMVHLTSPYLIEHCLWMLLQLYRRQWKGTLQSTDQLLEMLLHEVRQQINPPKLNAHQRRLSDLTRWIDDHLHEPLTVEALAQQAQLSGSRLFQLFGEHHEQSPMQYVQTRRMLRARQYLKDPYLSVKQVGCLCGYPDANLFVRTFRKHHDLPPRQWRLIHCV